MGLLKFFSSFWNWKFAVLVAMLFSGFLIVQNVLIPQPEPVTRVVITSPLIPELQEITSTTAESSTSTTTSAPSSRVMPDDEINAEFLEETTFSDDYWEEPSEFMTGNSSELELYNQEVHDRIRIAYRERLVSTSNYSLPPFADAKQIFKIAPKYGLASCEIEKCISTRLNGIICYLYDSTRFSNAGHEIETETWNHRHCGLTNEVRGVLKMGSRIREYNTIFVVRDPLARFISAFVDKCINEFPIYGDTCFKCHTDLSCLLDNMVEHAKNIVSKGKSIPFENLSYTMKHFYPQSWYCKVGKYHKHYLFLKYGEGENFSDNLIQILRNKRIAEFEIDRVRESLREDRRPAHATSGSDWTSRIRNEILSNATLLNQFMWFYESDYKLFDFKRPLEE